MHRALKLSNILKKDDSYKLSGKLIFIKNFRLWILKMFR